MKTIVVDFDGVLHSYVSGWQGATTIPDDPTPGAQDWIRALEADHWTVIVVSTRAETEDGRRAIIAWLIRWDFPPFVEVMHGKPPALVYVDDRALRFDGSWPTPEAIDDAAIPWNKR